MDAKTDSPKISAEERIYLRARVVLVGTLTAAYFVGAPYPGGPHQWWMYLALLGIIVVTTAALWFVALRTRRSVRRTMLWLLPLDLIAVSGFSYLFHHLEDAFFPVALLLPVSYALVVRKQETWMVSLAAAVAYLYGHVLSHDYEQWLIMFASAMKAVSIPLIAGMVASAVAKQRLREAEANEAAADRERLNQQMRQRISELQAVSEATELVHSSLDFESVGPLVLEILAKVIGVSECSLFVIDKTKSVTLFSANAGTSTVLPSMRPDDFGDESPFTCMSVFDHANLMVLFCGLADEVEALTPEDRLVLGAVASELVVAVENSRLYKLTKQLAVTDELTGLANYRFLQQRLDEEIERARRYNKSLSLLMLDADSFKHFNDEQGHLAGDVALAELGGVVSSVVREVDLVARYGGEEFSVLLPETDAAGAFIAAEKIREAVEQHLFATAEGLRDSHLSVSIGLATFPTHAWDKESLLREADDALYNAKHLGKNRVRAPKTRMGDAPTGHNEDVNDAKATQAHDEWTGV